MFDPLKSSVEEIAEYLKQFEPSAEVIKQSMIKGIEEMKVLEKASFDMNMTPLEYYNWKKNESSKTTQI